MIFSLNRSVERSDTNSYEKPLNSYKQEGSLAFGSGGSLVNSAKASCDQIAVLSGLAALVSLG